MLLHGRGPSTVMFDIPPWNVVLSQLLPSPSYGELAKKMKKKEKEEKTYPSVQPPSPDTSRHSRRRRSSAVSSTLRRSIVPHVTITPVQIRAIFQGGPECCRCGASMAKAEEKKDGSVVVKSAADTAVYSPEKS